MADEADDALADYVEQLGELTFNSKPLINTLTMVADDLQGVCAAAIVSAIEANISSKPPERKMPYIYLADSICKNVGSPYKERFAASLPALIGAAFAASGPKQRTSLQNLIKTWDGFFPPSVAQAAARHMAAPTPLPGAVAPPAPPAALVARARGAQPPGPPPPHASGQKRGRDDPREAARAELNGLLQRIRAHVGAGLPPDGQLLDFLGRALSICEHLAASAGSAAERQVVEAEMRDLAAKQVSALAPPLPPPPSPPPPSLLHLSRAPASPARARRPPPAHRPRPRLCARRRSFATRSANCPRECRRR